jgi:hypothetical protein
MPVPRTDAAAEAVIAEAEETARAVLARESRRVRRAGRKARAAQRVLADRARRAERRADRRRTGEQRRRLQAEKARRELLEQARRLREASGGSILECFRTVRDPRDPRGVRYALASVLALVTAAMLAGCETLAGIIAWISHAPREELEALGCRAAPCGRTVTRILAAVSPRALSRAVGAWIARAEGKGPVAFPVAGPALLPQVTCDGKEVRGALRPDGTNLFLLSAALTGAARRAASGAIVLADREIPAKTNEIPEIGPMLLELAAWFPLAGHVITADARRGPFVAGRGCPSCSRVAAWTCGSTWRPRPGRSCRRSRARRQPGHRGLAGLPARRKRCPSSCADRAPAAPRQARQPHKG